jgi:hypothetical protein
MLGMRGVDVGLPSSIGDQGVATVGRELRRRPSRPRKGRPPTAAFTDSSSSSYPARLLSSTAAVAGVKPPLPDSRGAIAAVLHRIGIREFTGPAAFPIEAPATRTTASPTRSDSKTMRAAGAEVPAKSSWSQMAFRLLVI